VALGCLAAALALTGAAALEAAPDQIAPAPVPALPTPPPRPAAAAPAATQPAGDGPVYLISKFDLLYLRSDPAQPPLEQVAKAKVTLGQTASGFVAPRPGVPTVIVTVAELSVAAPRPFYASAVRTIDEALRDDFKPRHLLGVYVAPDPGQISPAGKDLRPKDQTTLRILLVLGQVTQMRTLAFGERITKPEERIDNPLHQRLLDESPVQPAAKSDKDHGDLIRDDELDEYSLWRSRHPGRRVDYSLAPAPEAGGVDLDYAVTETKPWLAYAELSNTGTRYTNRWREQFGFRDYQLTNHDDVLAVDYTTADFNETNDVQVSYEAPLLHAPRIRWRVYGMWDEYAASDIGLNLPDFKGDSWNVGGEIIANVYQSGPWFFDLIGGARFENLSTTNPLPGTEPGDDNFFIPYVGGRVQQLGDWTSFDAIVTTEFQSSDINRASSERLANLGRPDVDESWSIMHWNITESVFLEPLFNKILGRDPAKQQHPTMAHELYFNFRGQSTFGQRVVPQYQMAVGGLYTVRGYPEAAVAGDDALVGTAEYRFHVPRAFAFEPEPKEFLGQPFRRAPQQVYGPVDWDLILRPFLDAAAVHGNAGAGLPSQDETLVGAGVGIELQYRRNITVRLDWGDPLRSIPGVVNAGASRLHFVLTLLY
jgi:hypothetical protein